MKVLLTGATSFTGMWFAEALARSGATVTAVVRGQGGEYQGTRLDRLQRVRQCAQVVEGVEFGDDGFLSLVAKKEFDVLCHHAARVTDYRSPDFDVGLALAENTRNFRRVLETMRDKGLKGVVATGSVFEQDEGIGDHPVRAFSPYGVSKGLSWQVAQYWCTTVGLPLGKFVISNPFGPFEEPRFTAYLIRCWREGSVAEVRTPAYLRDNIHVDLLALAYTNFVRGLVATGRDARLGPSGYRESQGSFTERFAAEMRPRLKLDCRISLMAQRDFPEPIVRLNPDTPDTAALGWDEGHAWDGVAEFYRQP